MSEALTAREVLDALKEMRDGLQQKYDAVATTFGSDHPAARAYEVGVKTVWNHDLFSRALELVTEADDA